jgi:hypothetical protein
VLLNCFNILINPTETIENQLEKPSLFRSFICFFISYAPAAIIYFNLLFSTQTFSIWGGFFLVSFVLKILFLVIFCCFLHGVADFFGDGFGSSKDLLSIVGITALPYLVLTPFYLLASCLSFFGIVIFILTSLVGLIWWLVLLAKAVAVVYGIEGYKAWTLVIFSLFLPFSFLILSMMSMGIYLFAI